MKKSYSSLSCYNEFRHDCHPESIVPLKKLTIRECILYYAIKYKILNKNLSAIYENDDIDRFFDRVLITCVLHRKTACIHTLMNISKDTIAANHVSALLIMSEFFNTESAEYTRKVFKRYIENDINIEYFTNTILMFIRSYEIKKVKYFLKYFHKYINIRAVLIEIKYIYEDKGYFEDIFSYTLKYFNVSKHEKKRFLKLFNTNE